ncbi:MAG TPA: ABC transporter ATP-binding protein [Acidimicrobiales bacterium]|nr:ABC transporter ATP-binding protein [Acidimicrobiales bacterium]
MSAVAETAPEVDAAVPLLEARNVTMRFGGLAALDDVTVQASPGMILGVVGPNGAGKTTLFGVLSGLLQPTHGDVLIEGDVVTGRTPQFRARRGLLRTFQRVQLFAELSVREHFQLTYRSLRGRPSYLRDLVGLDRRSGNAEEQERVDQLVESLGLVDVQHQPAAALPLGTARLVEVGRALAAGPKVVLLDEPSSGLDSRETEQLATVLLKARDEEGVALVLVEHDLQLVLGLSDRVDVLDFGRLIASGTPAEVRSDPVVQAAYIGTEATR